MTTWFRDLLRSLSRLWNDLSFATASGAVDAVRYQPRRLVVTGGRRPAALPGEVAPADAMEAAIDYAGLRIQGARRIIEHQAIGTKLSDCAIRLELARNLIWKAAWSLDNPEAGAAAGALPLHVMARVYTAEAAHEVTLLAAECFGAIGVMRDMPLQKHVHDARVFLHSDDADGAAKLAIAEAVAGYQRPQAAA